MIIVGLFHLFNGASSDWTGRGPLRPRRYPHIFLREAVFLLPRSGHLERELAEVAEP